MVTRTRASRELRPVPAVKPSRHLRHFPEASTEESAPNVAYALALQQRFGNRAATQMLQRETLRERWQKRKQTRQAKKENRRIAKGKEAKTASVGVTPDKKDFTDELEKHATTGKITGTTSWISNVKDEISQDVGNFASTSPTFKYDEIYASWLQDQGLPPDTQESDLTPDQQSDLEGREIDEGGVAAVSKNADIRDQLDIASGGIGSIAAGAGAVSGIVNFITFVSDLTHGGLEGDKLEKVVAGVEGIGSLGQAGFLAGQSAAMAGSSIAGGVATTGNETAGAASEMMGGIGEGLGGLGSSVEMFISGARGIAHAVKAVSKTGEKKQNALMAFNDFLSAGKAFLVTARGTINAVRTFLDIAGTASNFTSIVPIIGASINIFIQFLDIAVQLVEIVKQIIRIVRARRSMIKLETAKQTFSSADQQKMLENVKRVNRKRRNRAIIPLTASCVSTIADLVSIGGSVLNVIGVATSPAYGAGVGIMAAGYGLSAGAGAVKLGAGLAKPAFAGLRTVKQKGRDFAWDKTQKGPKTEWMKQKFQKVFDDESKTTENKNKAYQDDLKELFGIFAGLPDLDPADLRVQNPKADVVQKYKLYEGAYEILKATGVSKSKLFNAKSNEERVQILYAALKKRE